MKRILIGACVLGRYWGLEDLDKVTQTPLDTKVIAKDRYRYAFWTATQEPLPGL